MGASRSEKRERASFQQQQLHQQKHREKNLLFET